VLLSLPASVDSLPLPLSESDPLDESLDESLDEPESLAAEDEDDAAQSSG